MTSPEKDNHAHIVKICQNNEWFGRPKDSIKFFSQPLVPVVTIEGYWSTTDTQTQTLKPGGHGMLWKLALENGVFDWLAEHKRKKLLIRQINNPIAGVDNGLLAFTGLGCAENKTFGFASCPRVLNTPEGMDVLFEIPLNGKYEYRLSNVEYTEFEKNGIQDVPLEPGSRYSAFPCNTNILFADLQTVRHAAENFPIPGLLINMKNEAPFIDKEGHKTQVKAGRLESTIRKM